MASAARMCRSFALRIPFEDARSLRNASEYSAMGGSADGYQRRQQSVSIIHDGRRLIWNYNRPLVRQPAKLVHSRSRTRACALREWAEVPFIRPKQRQGTGDSAAADRNVDAICFQYRRISGEKPTLLLSANTIEPIRKPRLARLSLARASPLIPIDSAMPLEFFGNCDAFTNRSSPWTLVLHSAQRFLAINAGIYNRTCVR